MLANFNFNFGLVVLVACAVEGLASPVTTPTASTQSLAAHKCTPPKPPTNRPNCTSNSLGAFSLQLGTCGNKFDGLYLEPIFNSTSSTANTYVNLTATEPSYDYEYPPTFTYGPVAWRGLFAGAIAVPSSNNGTSGTSTVGVSGLSSFTFQNANDAATYYCSLQQDLTPVSCGYNNYDVTEFYVNRKTGQLFTAGTNVTNKGYRKVVPYIVQSCQP